MHFKRIRLSGFKSFVDPTEIPIEPGLTGIVGPNGCGKSNVLESIRWIMGENSPKSMRGSGMDDVIFSGTDRRPARNLAEVSLVLDNNDHTAPAAFNDETELEISRRIERESGSAYRINGKDVRAKDVQLFFADAATGAHSPALVSQGRVGALINAKPQNRRQILEEAAGITGLYQRRKEAESRLRAAENNLERLEDVMGQMDNQAANLKRQARQATRYRNISGDIRRTLATLLYLRWKNANADLESIASRLREAERGVADASSSVASLRTAEEKASALLPELRQEEAEKAAALHRLNVVRENMEAEEARRAERQEELENRLQQIAGDKAREETNLSEAQEALVRIKEEQNLLGKDSGDSSEEEAQKALAKAHNEANEAEETLDKLVEKHATLKATFERLEEDIASAQRRLERLANDEKEAKDELSELEGEDGAEAALLPLRKNLEKAQKHLTASRQKAEEAEEAKIKAFEKRDETRTLISEKRGVLQRIEAEIKGLEDLLDTTGNDKNDIAIADAIDVQPGYESAVGAALGDDLDAPESDGEKTGWQGWGDTTGLPSLPKGCAPLTNFVKGPDALAARLSMIGLVREEEGSVLSKKLASGQRLVSKEGTLWRWDGFVLSKDTPSSAVKRMAQKNRLQAIRDERGEALKAVRKTEEELAKAEDMVDATLEAERAARTARSEAETALDAARSNLQKEEEAGSERLQRLNSLRETIERIQAERQETAQTIDEKKQELESLAQPADEEEKQKSARQIVEEKRSLLAKARAHYDGLHRANEERNQRKAALERDARSWDERKQRAEEALATLEERKGETEKHLSESKAGPEAVSERREALLNEIQSADHKRKNAADNLAEAENSLKDVQKKLREAEARLGEFREVRAGLQAGHEASQTRIQELREAIDDEFHTEPVNLYDLAELKSDEDLPEMEKVETKLDRLKAERERLGAVNLRADKELEELQEQIEHLVAEKEDLEKAIARLRQAIGSLNREGRERMRAAFETVNTHFSTLFTSLFGGGHAHLELVESDDPLEAGLEIMASPPGKKLQSLSLLSGGEQALTALSLIFAVFMTNPSPICVLDEVDAPLDDANVDRFCDLLGNITKEAQTRFLIVTHNAVTMSRMDRLFGITMAERGVSQVVSVDLQEAEEMRAVG